MLFVADYSMKGPMQAWIATILLSILTVFFSPFGVLLGAIIALISLRINLTEGVKTLAMAMVINLAMNLWVNGSYWPGLVAVMEFMLPVWVLAFILRTTNDLSKTLSVSMLMAGLGVILFHLLVGDPQAWWQTLFQQDLLPILEQAGMQQNMTETFNQVADIITMLLALTAVVLWYSILLLARWWQGTLYYPGQFKADYYQLRLPRNMAILSVVIAVAGLFLEMSLLQSLTAVLMAGFMFQGVAILHHAVSQKEMSQAWLVGLYVFMFLFPQTILILATIGLMDTWMDVRSRWTNE